MALSRSRRALYDETGRGTGLHYCLLLGGIAIGGEESLHFAGASNRLSLVAGLSEPQYRLQRCSGGRSFLQVVEILHNGLAHECEMKEHC